MTLLPQSLKVPLSAHLEKVKALHAADLTRGFGEAPLPLALAGKLPEGWLSLGMAVRVSFRSKLPRSIHRALGALSRA